MALAEVSFFSQVLGLSVQANVILPQKSQGIGQAGAEREGDAPVLWLLHGASDDHTIWLRRTSIERYAAPLGLAVVMPAANLSFYTNMASGPRYFDYIAYELPEIMGEFFHFSPRREDNFIAGLSMGGYGALKLALSLPEQYAAAASLSGALDISMMAQAAVAEMEDGEDSKWGQLFDAIFDDPRQVAGGPHDLLHLLYEARQAGVDLPRLFVSCGKEDPLHAASVKFRVFAQSLGVPVTYHEEHGEHEWGYWDRNIQRVLEWLPLGE
jgi:S-formylglutathione hydrolase FrmB